MRKTIALGLALAAAAWAASAQERVDQTRPASKDGTVEVHNVSGSVRVTGWDRAEVAVTGTLGRGTERLEFTGSGGRTEIRVVLPTFAGHVQGSDLEVKVPSGSSLEVRTVSADTRVDGVGGRVDVESVSGTVDVGGDPREFEVRSVSGDVAITAAKAPGRAKSVSGDVTLSGVAGAVDAGSVSGRVSVKGGEVTRVELETTSGDIRFEAALAGDGRLDAKSVSGNVELTLPAAVAAEFDLTTFSGDIRNAFGPQAERTSEHGPGKKLSFSTGTGGRVVARSFSGNLILRKQ